MATLRCFFRQLSHKKFIKELNNNPVFRVINIRCLSYSSKEYTEEKDPAPYFFDEETQSLLKTLTRINLDVVFRRRKTGARLLSMPTYTFMPEDQYREAIRDAECKADEMLQMPPAVKIRKPIDIVLSRDTALKGLEDCPIVFTDITYGVKNFERLIVVREPDGTLRHADWDIRERMNQIYFPSKAKKYNIPKMFEDGYFENLLARKEYEFILDRACLQFEPNSTEYQKIVSVTYQHVDDNNGFERLRSTRHFGSLCFFLTWHKMIDNLLLELIETQNVREANVLLKLYCKLHNVTMNFKEVDDISSVEEYIKNYSQKKAPLELAVQAYKELERERIELEKGVRKAHGAT